MTDHPDAIVVGAGLAGLVATYELTQAGRRVLIVEQENRNNLGAQAFWSLAGLFLVDSPEQRRLGIKDSYDLAMQDWMGSAGFDRDREDHWPRQWAQAYVNFATTEKRQYLHDLGLRITPIVGWAERGGRADGHGNSVPRFHLTWGTGPELVRVFAEPVLKAEQQGLVEFKFRHQVDDLVVEDGAVVGVSGTVLEPSDLERGQASSREKIGEFEYRAPAVIVASGGIGHNHELIR
jgi:predicted oxidoreductase